MKQVNLRYQISLFGDFSEFSSSNILLTKMLFELFVDKGLMPAQFNEIKIDINTGKSETLSRTRLTDGENAWNINFNTDRIDFFLSNQNLFIYGMPIFDMFAKQVSEYYSLINSKYSKKINRIGVINNTLVQTGEINSIQQKNTNNVDFFKDKNVFEWSNRFATRIEEEGELINVHSEIGSIKIPSIKMNSSFMEFSGLTINIDVNTLGENLNPRFSLEDTINLIDKLKNRNNEVLRQIIERVNP